MRIPHRSLLLRQAVLPRPQIKQVEFVGIAGTKLWRLEVNSPDPVALCPKKRNEMVTDEATRAGYQDPSRLTHCSLPKTRIKARNISRVGGTPPHTDRMLLTHPPVRF